MDSMTRATYNATDNTLTELPGMEKPLIKDYVRVVRRPFGEVDSFTDSKYYEDLKKYEAELAKCRTIPCSPECRGLWEEGQKLDEGKDYEVRFVQCPDHWLLVESFNCPDCKHIAFPLPVKSEPPLAHIGAGEAMEKQETLCRDAAHILTETNNPNLSKEDNAYWNRWREYFTALWKLIEQGYIITKR